MFCLFNQTSIHKVQSDIMRIPYLQQPLKLPFSDTSMLSPTGSRLLELQPSAQTDAPMASLFDAFLKFCIYPAVSRENA